MSWELATSNVGNVVVGFERSGGSQEGYLYAVVAMRDHGLGAVPDCLPMKS